MEALFKKYFWVLNLLVLGVAAWLVARTITGYLATKYLAVHPDAGAVATAGEDPKILEKAPGDQIGEELVRRSPFNVEPKQPVTEQKEECKPECEDKECGDGGCPGGDACGKCNEGDKCEEGKCVPINEEDIAESELNVQLVGTWVNPADAEHRFANVLLNGADSDMVAVGSEILGGKATVVDIQPMLLYLREGEKLTRIALWAEQTQPKEPSPHERIRSSRLDRPDPSTSAMPRPVRPNSGDRFDYATGVKKMSEFEYQIDKQMLDEQLTDLTQLGMQARVIPNYRRGKYEGFKLVGVRPGSLYRAIGIRSGDIIRSINGKAINSPNKAMELFNQLKSSNAINLEVERRGKMETFNYSIQ